MSRFTSRLLVFVASAAVLVLEIMAGRLLAPYVGVTLETFTAIIGTVLAGISLGAWAGGRLADRIEPRSMLGPLLMAGGVLALAAPTLVEWTGPAFRGGGPVEIVVLAAIAFFLPAVVLSAVTPVVVKLELADLSRTGTVVGSFTAVGTAGAIFGTFLTGFVLLAALPTRPIMVGVGGLLVVWGTGLAIRLRSITRGTVALVVVAALGTGGALAVVEGPCDRETTYYCARVEVDPDRPSGRILVLDDIRHSYVDLDDPTYLGFRYVELIADTITTHLDDGPVDALYVGGGGFTLPRWLSSVRPGSSHTVLELDGGLVDIAVAELGLRTDAIDRIEIGDARLTLQDTPEGAFDVVVGDAFGGISVPWHLTTREFLEEVRARLRPGGVYVMNVLDRPPNAFARAEAATLLEVFDHVAVIAPPDYLQGEAGGNFVFAASEDPLDIAGLSGALEARDAESVVIVDKEVRLWIAGAPVLRDDFAPVDQLLTRR